MRLPMRLAMALLTAWGLLMIVPDLYRIIRPLASAGFAADNDGRIYDVRGPFARDQDSPAWRAGLRVGDRIDLEAMHCAPPRGRRCQSLVSVVGGMGGAQLVRRGRALTVTIQPSGGEPARTVTVVAESNPAGWLSRLMLFLNELAGIAVVVASAWLAWTQPNPMTIGFWLYALWFNPGQDFVYYLALQDRPILAIAQEVLSSIAHGAGAAGLLLFALRVPNDRAERAWQPVMYLLPVIALAIAALQLVSYATILGYPTEGVSRATFFADYAVDVLALVILLRRRRGHPPAEYQRMRWVVWGCMIGLPAYILSGLLQSTSLWHTLTGSASIPMGIISLLLLGYGILGWFVFEAIRRPRVISVFIPLRRISVFALLISVPLVFADRATDRLHDALDLPDWGWILVASGLVYLTSRVHEWSAKLADHAFNRAFRRQTTRLAEVGRQMLVSDRREVVERLLVEAPVEQLDLASAAVFRRDGSAYRRCPCAIGWSAGTAEQLSPQDAGLGASTTKPARIDPWDAEHLGLPTGLAAPTVAIPVEDKVRRFAFALYGPHTSGADLTVDERDLLLELAGDAAVAYRRTEMLALRHRVADLEAQVSSPKPTAPAEAEAAGSGRGGPRPA